MRVLVCGGRAYPEAQKVAAVLDAIRDSLPEGEDLEIIEGHAGEFHKYSTAPIGADFIAHQYAQDHKLILHCYPAQWKRDGKAAGPIRNAKMLKDARPQLVLAFPGGTGTRGMKEIAEKAGVEVLDIED